MLKLGVWIGAFRLRTLPLALSCTVLGSLLALADGMFETPVFILCLITTLCLQILSNLANDLGDFQHGTDNANRQGPKRATQSGAITPTTMKKAIAFFVGLSLVSGLILLYISFKGLEMFLPVLFFIIGLAAIAGAIKYTYGKKPYGYSGFGDAFVFVFFGLVGVVGTYFLHTKTFNADILLPSASLGFLCAGVLNLNNIRDIDNDNKNHKFTIAVRLGRKKAVYYHFVLILLAFLPGAIFIFANKPKWPNLMVLFLVPLFIRHLIVVFKAENIEVFNKELRNLALLTFVFSIVFGLAQAI